MSTHEIALARDVGQYLGLPESDLPPPAAVPQVVLRDGDRVLKVDAEEYAAVYARAYGGMDVSVGGRTHKDALRIMAVVAAEQGLKDFAGALKRFGETASACVRVADEDGRAWKPGQQPVRQERAATVPDDQGLVAAEIHAFLGAEE